MSVYQPTSGKLGNVFSRVFDLILMDGKRMDDKDLWAREALEQARIILAHLESGGRDCDFLRPHALSLLQTIDVMPSGILGRRYLL